MAKMTAKGYLAVKGRQPGKPIEKWGKADWLVFAQELTDINYEYQHKRNVYLFARLLNIMLDNIE